MRPAKQRTWGGIWMLAIALAMVGAGCEVERESRGDGAGGGADGGDGFDTGCNFVALAAQCPPSSRPLFGEDAAARCRQALEGGDGYETGLDAGFCGGEGTCIFACNFDNPCDCGVERVTGEGVFCVDCADSFACGNGICEPGESPETCPVDCAPVCTPEDQRCSGTDVETCTAGRWTLESCQLGSACTYLPAQRRAWCAPRAAVFEEGLPVLDPPRVAEGDWRAFIHPRGRLRCASHACVWRGFLEGGDASRLETVTSGGQPRQIQRYDHDSRAFARLDPVPVETVSLRGRPCAQRSGSSGQEPRQPTTWVNPETGQSVPLQMFVDDTVPLACDSEVYRPELDRVFAAMRLDNRFVLLGQWELSSGRFLGTVRFSDPQMPNARTVDLWTSEDGRLVAQTLVEGSITRTIIWKPEQRSYAGIIEGRVHALQPGGTHIITGDHRQLEVMDLSTGDVWTRPPGQALDSFTPDGRYVVGTSADIHGETRLTLYHVGTGRLFHRFPLTGEGRFSPNGRWLVVGDAVYGSEPEPW